MKEFLPEFKICSKCKKKKRKEEFSLRFQSPDGLQPTCKLCYASNTHRRNLKLQSDFGITQAQYDLMLKSQGGVCAVCGKPETLKHQSGKILSLAVDHCHKTMRIRGILCHKCNSFLGYSGDDPELLEKAIAYLRK